MGYLPCRPPDTYILHSSVVHSSIAESFPDRFFLIFTGSIQGRDSRKGHNAIFGPCLVSQKDRYIADVQ